MPFRPSACCQAVYRHTLTNLEPLWITDEILSNAYKRFWALSRPARRYGSHVPGPMESRRRTGKRRIAHMTDMGNTAHTTPMNDFAALWNALGTRDPTQWRWEPPAASVPVTKEAKIKLPTWLTNYTSVTEEKVVKEAVLDDEMVGARSRPEGTLRQELATFRKGLATTTNFEELCSSFNRTVEQKLMLGLFMDEELGAYLRTVTRHLNKRHLSEKQAIELCLDFYNSVWNGMAASRVMSVGNFNGWVLNLFLKLLSKLNESPEAKLLAAKIRHHISGEQLLQVKDEALTLVKGWALSWMDEIPNGPRKNLVEASVLALAKVLDFLPQEKAVEIVKQLTLCFRKEFHHTDNLGSFPLSWLNMAAHMKNVDEILLLNIWKAMDQLMVRKQATDVDFVGNWPLAGVCDVVLSHWISCDVIKDPTSVRKTIATLMHQRPENYRLSCLIAAIHLNKELAFRRSRSLFRILRGLGYYPTIYETFKHLPELGIKYPLFIVSSEIKAIIPKDYVVAFKIYKLYLKIRMNRECLNARIDGQCPEFFIQMIHNRMPPQDIWILLRIPIYHSIWFQYRNPRYPRRDKALHPARISLICRMATEFAHAPHLTPRQSRRNVTQCLLYLKKHLISIKGKPDLTRAVVHCGITRELVTGKWVGTETLKWVLRWVEVAEGEHVAARLAALLEAWREEHLKGKRWEIRDRNVLRVGDIS